MDHDWEFLYTFNDYYPFERYIIKEPKSINSLFDDLVLTEIFVPSTEIKMEKTRMGNYAYTSIDPDEIYIKVKGSAGEMRLSYFDFSTPVRETIRGIIFDDFGKFEWEELYVDYEDLSKLQEVLHNQQELISKKYGSCPIKGNFNKTFTMELLK